MGRLKVSEIFKSIQGESSYAGKPCIFIRLAGCNLRCNFCDTRYAYEKGVYFAADALLKKVLKYKTGLVCITGGEPLIQKDIFRVIDGLIRGGKKVLIETNGSVCIKDVNKKAIIIMDIKCPLSGQSGSFLVKNLKHIKSKDEIKFVISGRKDYLWAKRTAERFKGKKCGILFSPARGFLKASDLADWMLDDDLNARLNIQLHKVIWPGRNRGI
ncbi:MAG: radical SAM protein [Candidatus Aureabacteria bacterium]|nr:radical SAM protein [Candidatus Auribacterota bacterium]